jgi:hypothetical protein
MNPSRRRWQLDESESPSYGEADERNGRGSGVTVDGLVAPAQLSEPSARPSPSQSAHSTNE